MRKQAGSVRSGKHRRDAREEPEERKQGDKDVFACPAPRSKGKLRPSLLQWRQTGRYAQQRVAIAVRRQMRRAIAGVQAFILPLSGKFSL